MGMLRIVNYVFKYIKIYIYWYYNIEEGEVN